MSKEIKCECGHVNPFGTEICESCGKPLEAEKTELLNMRYEGVARRSQTYNKTIIDKIWNFFSSVKVGIWIIVITLVASSIGTIFPQEMYIPPRVNPARFYAEEYGFLGQLYYQLGFHDLYGSWWYMLLIAALGVSLTIASLDRVVPLYRALKTQRVTRHENFLKRQRIFGTSKVSNDDAAITKVKENLEKRKYNVTEENGNLVGEKGRFSRWGPYVNHIGIIIFLIGCMLRYFPGMYIDDFVWIREGEIEVIPGTNQEYYLKNEKFIVELYDEDDEVFGEAIRNSGATVVKTYQTNAVLFKREETDTIGADAELVEVDRHEILVNQPFKFDGFALYQVDYKLHELNEMSFNMLRKGAEEPIGGFSVNLFDPQAEYDLGDGYKVKVRHYFPDYFLNDQGQPASQSRIPNNPAFIFEMVSPEHPDGEVSFLAIGQNLEPFGENDYQLRFDGVETKNVTALTVRKDYTLGILIVGGLIFMIGLIQGSYWVHRRIWFQRINGEIWIAGHTNKNWNSLKDEVDRMIEGTELSSPVDQVALKEDEKQPKEEVQDGSFK
ncbi:cytochrome c biogenesis protein ResB [Alkalihalobacterium chitinilyticum]|uniref:Cytochrome c biogenesis protein ResB n=1 Tax=Alkalihalobacterium chitinilyticum TaxID=2980103 RepID=A0ABT5V9P2_9BACI|nr:cytochrome c biogenesis protein ResB [Alkalihalobacterium chitinilyticum]MDE5412005.1 cytochrome c biogenesis protein ResB [Alkalihalobacterium chitinilyticum]